METPQQPAELIDLWKRRLIVAQQSQYATAVKLEKRNNYLGLLSVIFNTIVGSVVFATLTDQANVIWVKVVAGGMSLLAAVLTGIQTLRRDGEKAERHRLYGAKFSNLKRELEMIATCIPNDPAVETTLKNFHRKYSRLVEEAPVPDEKIFAEHHRRYLSELSSASRLQFDPRNYAHLPQSN